MSDYLNKTEEQQFEDAKSWFKQNGTPILTVIFIIAASTFGWNFWKKHQLENAQKTSAQYQQVMESYLQDPAKNAPLASKFIEDNRGSSYAVFAQLELAKQLVNAGNFEQAKIQLTEALNGTSDATLENVIRFRLANVDLQLKAYEDALAHLAKVEDSAWAYRKHLLTGDVLVAKGDKEGAKAAYEQAKQAVGEQDPLLIDLRMNNL